MTPAKIRLAQPDEAAEIAALVDAAYAMYVSRLGRKPGPMLDDYAARIAAGEAWILECDGIVGLLVLVETNPGLMIHNVALLPQAQGQGFGKRLMAFAEEEAVRRGHSAIDLYTHVKMVENQARYLHLGYKETGRRVEEGFERVYMRKEIEVK